MLFRSGGGGALTAPAGVCSRAAGGRSTAVLELVVDVDGLGDDDVVELRDDVVEVVAGGSSPPPWQPTKASATARQHAAYARSEPTLDLPFGSPALPDRTRV